jgi:diaminopimelate decarboxylase
MTRSTYERPTIVKTQVGMMNKLGRRADLRAVGEVDGVPIDRLCKTFGSPLFVFSERRMRARMNEAKLAFRRNHPSTRFGWSYKTNYLNAICAVFHAEGSLAEVVSGMEYEKARRLGVPGCDIIFNGPAKTEAELERAVREGAVIHADHSEEIVLLERIAERVPTPPVVGLRVSVDAGIHPRWDRFGFDLESGQALDAARRIVQGGRLKLGGLHTHIGTFILEPAAYGRATAKLRDFATTIRETLGVDVTHLDLGGGFASNNTLAAQYHSGALVPPIAEYAEAITRELRDARWPLLIETGRALIDDAGTLLTSVIATKRLSTGRRAIVIDAGVNLLFTAWWYRLGVSPARAADAFVEDTTIYGPLCMNIDCVRESVPLPDLRPGEHLAIHPAGAYTLTQSMQFIKLRPACVLVSETGEPELIRRAEVLEDLSAPELLPERLRVLERTK